MDKQKLVLFDIDHTLFDTERFKESRLEKYSLYDEVLKVLSELSKITTLGIFSQGELDFQKTKLKNTKIDSFFKEENVHVFKDKELNFAQIFTKYPDYKIFFVDDRLDLLFSAKKNFPAISTIWIKRGPHAKNLTEIENFSPDKTVSNLQEIVKFVVK